MFSKKALVGSLLAANLIVTATYLTGHADPPPVQSHKACTDAKACDHKHCGHQSREAMMAEFQEKLGLSAAQKQQFDTIRKEADAKSGPIAQQVFAKRKALYEYLADPQAAEPTALAKQAEINELRNQLSQQRLSTLFRLKAVLTPEQQQKASTLMKEKMREKMADCEKRADEKGEGDKK